MNDRNKEAVAEFEKQVIRMQKEQTSYMIQVRANQGTITKLELTRPILDS